MSRRLVLSLCFVAGLLLHGSSTLNPVPAVEAHETHLSEVLPLSRTHTPLPVTAFVAPEPIQSPFVTGALASPLSTVPCESIWSGGLPRVDTGLTACSEYSNEHDNGADYRVFYPAEWDANPTGGWGTAYLEPAREAIRHSVDVYGAYGVMGSVTLVFSVNNGPAEADESLYELDAVTSPSHEGCAIFAYPNNRATNADYFRQLIAHEMFHCFQDGNFFGSGGSYGPASLWWVDGSANYFSNVAYPSVNMEWQSIAQFDANSPAARLTQMQYAASFFFQYLGNTVGDKEIINFLATLPAAGTEADQQAALRAYGGMEDMFQQYAQQYLDGTLMDTSGVAIPFSPTFTTVMQVNTSGSTEISIHPFVIQRAEVAFDPSMTISYSVAATSGTSRHGYRLEGGTWGPPPELVDCGDPHAYKAAFTSVGDSTTSPAIITVTTGTTTAECENNETDSCLHGDWVVSDYAAFLQAALGMAGAASGGAPITLDGVSGDLRFTFDADTITYSAVEFELRGSTVVQGLAVSVAVRLDGEATAGYDVVETGTIDLVEINPGSLTIEAEAFVNGSSMGITPVDPMQWIFFLSPMYGYTCSASQLDLTIPPLAVPVVLGREG